MNQSTTNPNQSARGIQLISTSLPKGGGSIQGMGETFTPNEFSGSAGMSLSIPVSPCRGFEPSLNLNYSSGNGNSPFGLGWELSLPEITRRTSKEIPRYTDEDTFLYTDDDYLVPLLNEQQQPKVDQKTIGNHTYQLTYFQPRTQDNYDQIIRYENTKETTDNFWVITNTANITSVFGKRAVARICDPKDPSKIFKWLLEEVYDDKGNHQVYTYLKENTDNIPKNLLIQERDCATQTYLDKIYYGNDKSISDGALILGESVTQLTNVLWHFEIIFDYGAYNINPNLNNTTPYTIPIDNAWSCRQDVFSDYTAGFEIRTHRLCQNVLLFHRFKELNTVPVLTSVLKLSYSENPLISLLSEATHMGYQYQKIADTYLIKSLPAVTFDYTPFALNKTDYHPHAFQAFTGVDNQTLKQGANAPYFQLVDLYGEGIPGVLYNDNTSMYYRSAKAVHSTGIEYGETKAIPFPNAPTSNQHVLMDVTGNGRLDLMVNTPQQAGYYALSGVAKERCFQTFETFPSDYTHPLNESLDVTGDGTTDVLLIEENEVRVNPSLGSKGFASAIQQKNEQDIPYSMPGAANEHTFFAPMIGNGLAQRVRITKNNVECWSNLGYGKFGKKVVMNNAPDFGSDFNINRLLWADIDGSGTTDLVYLYPTHVHIYLNQSGNSFTKTPIVIPLPKKWDPLCQVQFADVMGNGTNCLVFSKTHPHPQFWYYDFNHIKNQQVTSQKPWLLKKIDNNMGAVITIQYASSTQYYLEDKAKNISWITKLPFPVNVIASVTHQDEISNTKTTSNYHYRHGYYDSSDREFRGFGRVDHINASTFEDFKASNSSDAYQAPPIYTKTWYHTGVFLEEETLEKQLQKEYWQGDVDALTLPNTNIDYLSNTQMLRTEQEAYRTLHGAILRKEVYGNDDTPWKNIPYTVSETQYRVEEKQLLGANKYSVFQLINQQNISYDYERNAEDPKVHHSFNLTTNPYGTVIESCQVTYPRRKVTEDLDVQTQKQQKQLWISYEKIDLFNSKKADAFWGLIPPNQHNSKEYFIDIPLAHQQFEINGKDLLNGQLYFDFNKIAELVNRVEHQQLLYWERHYYFDVTQQKELAFGQVTVPALHHRTESVEFDQSKLKTDFDSQVIENNVLVNLMTNGNNETHGAKGGYITFVKDENQPNQEKYYWNPGSAQSYHTQGGFCLPKEYYDPFQYSYINHAALSQRVIKTYYIYDDYYLFIKEITDPYQNQIQLLDFDYQILHPRTIQDINSNTHSVLFDPLGMVIATSENGTQEGKPVGFGNLSEFTPFTKDQIHDFLNTPTSITSNVFTVANFFYYDLHAWKNDHIPTHAVHITRTNYLNEDADFKIQIDYRDGFGRELQGKTYCDAPQITRRWDSGIQKIVEENVSTGWLTSGAVIYDDKGHTIKRYEPYFASHWYYVDEQVLNQVGHTSTIFYDALGRQVLEHSPEGFYSKTLLGTLLWLDSSPLIVSGFLNEKLYGNLGNTVSEANQKYLCFVPNAWSSLAYDRNDCINISDYQPTDGINIDTFTFNKSKVFANTPHIHIENALGKVIQSEQLLVSHENERNANFFTFDIQGNELTSADQRLHAVSHKNFQYTYNLTKKSIKVVATDAGAKWSLQDVVGNPIYSNDSRNTQQFYTYDVLHRPTETYVNNSNLGIDQVVQKIMYGDSRFNPTTPYFKLPEKLNLRGKTVIHFDQSGLNIIPSYDIHGHPLLSAQWLKKGYQEEANWNSLDTTDLQILVACIIGKYTRNDYYSNVLPHTIGVSLMPNVSEEPDCFITSTTIDALGRKLNSTDADGNIQTPTYYATNWIKSLNIIAGIKASSVQAPTPGFTNVHYNAKGMRTSICFDNGTKTTYSYDPFNFELTEIKSTRKKGNNIEVIQHLQYHHDPVGNVTGIVNLYISTVFFNNQQVSARTCYTYNSLYQLIKVIGRENAGMWKNTQSNQNKFNKVFFANMGMQLRNGRALQNYIQNYTYDESGNLTTLNHGAQATTRTNTIQLNNNQILSSGYGYATPKSYRYDANGNMTTLDGRQGVKWNYRNNMSSAIILERENAPNDAEYYVYNTLGQRVRKVQEQKGVNNSTTIKEVIYLGGIEVRKTYTVNSSGTVNTSSKEWHCVRLKGGTNSFCTWRYWVTGTVGIEEKKVQFRYQHSDTLNSSILELDENAKVITYEEYYPYGGTSIVTATNQTEIKNKHYHYSNQEKDSVTGLYYYGMRYYSPWLARWTCTDPAGTIDGLNIYVFVKGNPVTHVDVGGMKKSGGKKKTSSGMRKISLDKKPHFKRNKNGKYESRGRYSNQNAKSVQRRSAKRLKNLDNLKKTTQAFVKGIENGTPLSKMTKKGLHMAHVVSAQEIRDLLTSYANKINNDFHNSMFNQKALRNEGEKFIEDFISTDAGGLDEYKNRLKEVEEEEEYLKEKALQDILKRLNKSSGNLIGGDGPTNSKIKEHRDIPTDNNGIVIPYAQKRINAADRLSNALNKAVPAKFAPLGNLSSTQ